MIENKNTRINKCIIDVFFVISIFSMFRIVDWFFFALILVCWVQILPQRRNTSPATQNNIILAHIVVNIFTIFIITILDTSVWLLDI